MYGVDKRQFMVNLLEGFHHFENLNNLKMAKFQGYKDPDFLIISSFH